MHLRSTILIFASSVAALAAMPGWSNPPPSAATGNAVTAPAAEEKSEPPRKATRVELRDLAEKLPWLRGRFQREAIGMSFSIPRGQHLLAGVDARKADMALRGEDDPSLIGWMVPMDKTVTDANLRIIRLRWRHDGLVAPEAAPFDAASLLQTAQGGPRVPRLSGSGGTLLRYVDVPDREGPTILWSEERQADGASARVYDCHALHLARKDVLEISIVGADANAAKSCTDELRAIASTVRFEVGAEYPAQTRGERVASYSLAGLITQTQ